MSTDWFYWAQVAVLIEKMRSGLLDFRENTQTYDISYGHTLACMMSESNTSRRRSARRHSYHGTSDPLLQLAVHSDSPCTELRQEQNLPRSLAA